MSSWSREITPQIDHLLGLVRAFDYSPATDEAAADLSAHVAKQLQRRTIDVHDRYELLACSLLSEYYEAIGQREKLSSLLEPVIAELASEDFTWSPGISLEDKKLSRQQVLCLLMWATYLFESGDSTTIEAGGSTQAWGILELAKQGLCLLEDKGFPCHGTRYHECFLEGLLLRDDGRLNEAEMLFARAAHHARQRLDLKKLKLLAKGENKQVVAEERFCRVCIARTVAFGLAETSFIRGAFLTAEALFSIAIPDLDQTKFSKWRRLAELYLLQCQTQTIDFDDRPAVQNLERIAERIGDVGTQLKKAKVHPEYQRLALLFRLWTLLRAQQIRSQGDAFFPMVAGASAQMVKLLDVLSEEEWEWSNGPIGRLNKRIYCEILLRINHPDASKHLDGYLRSSRDVQITHIEAKLLNAERHLLQQRPKKTIDIATRCLESRDILPGQRLWAKAILTWARKGASLDVDLAQESVLEAISSGYLRAQVVRAKMIADSNTIAIELPFEKDGNFDVEVNIKALEEALVVAVVLRHPDNNQLQQDSLGREKTWLSGKKKRMGHRFKSLLPPEASER